MTTKKEFLDLVDRSKEEKKYEGLQFFRCTLCQGVVSPWDLREIHECPKCAGRRMMPTNLTLWEKIIQVWKHPKVWGWKDVQL